MDNNQHDPEGSNTLTTEDTFMIGWPGAAPPAPGLMPVTPSYLRRNQMPTATIQREPEGSEPLPRDYEVLIKGITRDSIRRRLRYTPNLKRDGIDITLVLYGDEDRT